MSKLSFALKTIEEKLMMAVGGFLLMILSLPDMRTAGGGMGLVWRQRRLRVEILSFNYLLKAVVNISALQQKSKA